MLLYVQLKCNKSYSELNWAVLCFRLLCLSGPVCGLVSLASLSHETRLVTVRRKRGKEGGRQKEQKGENNTICGTHWISFVMFVKPAGNAYLVRGGGMRLGALSKGSACWTIEKAGPLSSKHGSYTYTHSFSSYEWFVCMCLLEEVIKESKR